MNRTAKMIAAVVVLGLVLAAPAHGFVAAWVQRAIMIVQQVTQIGKQVEQIKQFQEKLDTAKEQIEMVKDLKESARDGLNALTEPFRDLISAPADLVSDTMTWGGEFTGDARRTFDAARDFGRNARSLREGLERQAVGQPTRSGSPMCSAFTPVLRLSLRGGRLTPGSAGGTGGFSTGSRPHCRRCGGSPGRCPQGGPGIRGKAPEPEEHERDRPGPGAGDRVGHPGRDPHGHGLSFRLGRREGDRTQLPGRSRAPATREQGSGPREGQQSEGGRGNPPLGELGQQL